MLGSGVITPCLYAEFNGLLVLVTSCVEKYIGISTKKNYSNSY